MKWIKCSDRLPLKDKHILGKLKLYTHYDPTNDV
jgi:hypothetical protein